MSYLPTEDVAKIGQINFQGNVIPSTWFKEITKKNGLPDVNAIILLGEIVYWYRPVETRDENTGEMKYYRKFHGEVLQKSYEQLTLSIGLSYKQLKSAFINLERLGLAKRDLKNLNTEKGYISNSMHVIINPERIAEITNKELKKFIPSVPNGKEVRPKREGGPSQTGHTYTETTTKTSPETIDKTMVNKQTMSFGKNKIKYNGKTLDVAKRWKISNEQLQSYYWLKDMNIPTEDKRLVWWAKNYSLERLQSVYYEAKSAPKCDHIGKYMYSLLERNCKVSNADTAQNKEFAETYKYIYNWKELKILKRYVKIPHGHEFIELSLDSNPDHFSKTLREYHNRIDQTIGV